MTATRATQMEHGSPSCINSLRGLLRRRRRRRRCLHSLRRYHHSRRPHRFSLYPRRHRRPARSTRSSSLECEVAPAASRPNCSWPRSSCTAWTDRSLRCWRRATRTESSRRLGRARRRQSTATWRPSGSTPTSPSQAGVTRRRCCSRWRRLRRSRAMTSSRPTGRRGATRRAGRSRCTGRTGRRRRARRSRRRLSLWTR